MVTMGSFLHNKVPLFSKQDGLKTTNKREWQRDMKIGIEEKENKND